MIRLRPLQWISKNLFNQCKRKYQCIQKVDDILNISHGDKGLDKINCSNDITNNSGEFLCSAILSIGSRKISKSRGGEFLQLMKMCEKVVISSNIPTTASHLVDAVYGAHKSLIIAPWFFKSFGMLLIDRLDELGWHEISALSQVYGSDSSNLDIAILKKISTLVQNRVTQNTSDVKIIHLSNILIPLAAHDLVSASLLNISNLCFASYAKTHGINGIVFVTPKSIRAQLEAIVIYCKSNGLLNSKMIITEGGLDEFKNLDDVQRIIYSNAQNWCSLPFGSDLFEFNTYEIIKLVTCMQRLNLKVPDIFWDFLNHQGNTKIKINGNDIIRSLVSNSESPKMILFYFSQFENIITPSALGKAIELLANFESDGTPKLKHFASKSFVTKCVNQINYLSLKQVVQLMTLHGDMDPRNSHDFLRICMDGIVSNFEYGNLLEANDLITVLQISQFKHAPFHKLLIQCLTMTSKNLLHVFSPSETVSICSLFANQLIDSKSLFKDIANNVESNINLFTLLQLNDILTSFIYSRKVSLLSSDLLENIVRIAKQNDDDGKLPLSLKEKFHKTMVEIGILDFEFKSNPSLEKDEKKKIKSLEVKDSKDLLSNDFISRYFRRFGTHLKLRQFGEEEILNNLNQNKKINWHLIYVVQSLWLKNKVSISEKLLLELSKKMLIKSIPMLNWKYSFDKTIDTNFLKGMEKAINSSISKERDVLALVYFAENYYLEKEFLNKIQFFETLREKALAVVAGGTSKPFLFARILKLYDDKNLSNEQFIKELLIKAVRNNFFRINTLSSSGKIAALVTLAKYRKYILVNDSKKISSNIGGERDVKYDDHLIPFRIYSLFANTLSSISKYLRGKSKNKEVFSNEEIGQALWACEIFGDSTIYSAEVKEEFTKKVEGKENYQKIINEIENSLNKNDKSFH